MQILLIRHARQNSPLCNVNAELSKEGIRQAELLKERICGLKPDLIYTSSLLRAKQTAGILFDSGSFCCPAIPILERPELDEISFGELTGRSDRENKILFPEYFEAKKRREENLRIPGGENPTEVFERAYPVLKEIIIKDVSLAVLVTHGGVIRSLVAGLVMSGPEHMLLVAEELQHTGVTELSYTGASGKFSLERLNDYSHLYGFPELLRSSFKK